MIFTYRHRIGAHFLMECALKGAFLRGTAPRGPRGKRRPRQGLARCSRWLCASYHSQPEVSRASSTSSMAHSMPAASARVRDWDRSALLSSTETASMFTADW